MGLTSSQTAPTRRAEMTRLESPRLAWMALAALLLAGGVILVYETRGTTFFLDEWAWALGRRGDDVGTFLRPHNSHLSLVPILIYRALFATAGLDHYWPYRVVVIVAHLGCVTLVFAYTIRRVGGLLALLAAALVLFLGPAYQNFLWPFQVSWLISLGAGVGALLMLDRRDRPGDIVACALLAVSIASSGLGLAIAAGVLVDVLWGRRRWRDAWIVAVPIALYLVWWVQYQDSNWIQAARDFGVDQPVLTGILQAPQFAANSAASAMSALAGLAGQTGVDLSGRGTFLTWGPVLLIAAGAAVLIHLGPRKALSPRVLALLTIAAAFWLLTGVTRGFISAPYTSRYLYVGGLFIVLMGVELARDIPISGRAAIVLALAVAAAVVSNIGALRDGGRYLRAQANVTRAEVGTLDITRNIIRPDYASHGFLFDDVVAGPYFAAEDALGTPAASAAEIAKMPESVRTAADAQLIDIHRVAVTGASDGVRQGAKPTAEGLVGGTTTAAGGCLVFRPAPFTPQGAPAELRVAVPPAGLLVTADGGPVALGLRRFADAYEPVGRLATGASGILRLVPDRAVQPWHVRVAPAARARACGLA